MRLLKSLKPQALSLVFGVKLLLFVVVVVVITIIIITIIAYLL